MMIRTRIWPLANAAPACSAATTTPTTQRALIYPLNNSGLALAELELLARALLAVLLALLGARVARKQPAALQRVAQVRAKLDQEARYPQRDGIALARDPAAANVAINVVLVGELD